MARSGGSLTGRAVLAVALMVLFYVIAIGAVVGLVYAGWQTGAFAFELRGRALIYTLILAGALVFAAVVVAWSVIPRIDHFEPPGPELTESDCPELFAEIRAIGRATGQEVPKHVYLVPEVNAFVTERGGVMGFGSRRVMGIGLPLLQILTVPELRGVVAHEFGHFHGGDTKLGPWIYKTRAAVGRTVVNLARTREVTEQSEFHLLTLVMAIVEKPFEWFGIGFMRITQAISRRQEHQADALAARIVGTAPMVTGLMSVHGGALGYHAYFGSEVSPLLEAGFRPPITDGFARFMGRSDLRQLVDRAVAEELSSDESDPFDSHPPLRERVDALEALAAPEPSDDTRRAIDLVGDVSDLERRLFEDAFEGGGATKPIEWTDVIDAVYVPAWRKSAKETAGLLAAYTPATIPRDHHGLQALLHREIGDHAHEIDEDDRRSWATNLMATMITVKMLDRGFSARTEPGAPIRLARGDLEFAPFAEVARYLDGTIDQAEWIGRMQTLDIADLPLTADSTLPN